MKRVYTLIICLLALGLSSCDLDRSPYDAIATKDAFKTVDDATAFNTGMYSYLRNRVYGIFDYTTDVQSDLLHGSTDYGNRNGLPYTWTFNSGDYNLRDVWMMYYDAIASINLFLDNVDQIPTSSTAEQAAIAKYKGEAYLLRAYYYHQLVKRYAKDYEPSSATTDKGLPIVTTYDLTFKPTRSSVEATYQQILSDIASAKTLLTTVGTPGAIRMTKDCITALEARVYLCMHKFDEAAAAADVLISSNTYPLATTAAAFKKIWHEDDLAESIMQVFASAPTELPSPAATNRSSAVNNIYLGYNAATGTYIPDFIPEQWVVDLYYDNNDVRKAVYLEKKTLTISNTQYPGIYLLNKYPTNPALNPGGTTPNYQHKPKVFRIAEMYLIKAEALASKAIPDLNGAMLVLNDLKTKRGLAAMTSSASVMDSIKVERTREMLCEGTRLDDLARWKMGVTRGAPQNQGIVALGYNLSKPANDNKMVWGIPNNDITTNPNLTNDQNPGW